MSIDTHAHLAVPAASALVAGTEGFQAELAAEQIAHSPESLRVNQEQLRNLGPLLTDPQLRLKAMNEGEIDITIVGPMPMHHYWADADLAVELARIKNDGVAEHVSAAPDRLKGMGTVPLQHPDLAVAELDRISSEHGFTSISVSTNVNGMELADPLFAPVWARCAELGTVVFIHPWGCSLGARLGQHYLGNTVGQPTETTVALSHLIFSGTLDRHPELKLLAAHGGGYLPTYMGRSDHAWSVRSDARNCAKKPSEYLSQITFDSLVYTPTALRFLVEAVGASQVVLGTDYPFDMGVTDPVARLREAGFDSATQNAIAHENAMRLFGLEQT
jgi:aminocarboxymuconate-semialdehyde decarboxylase